MFSKNIGALYLENDYNSHTLKRRFHNTKPLLATLLVIVITLTSLLSAVFVISFSNKNSPIASSSVANAFDIFCSDDEGFGDFMSRGSAKNFGVRVMTEHGHRNLSVKETIGRNLVFVNYHGEQEIEGQSPFLIKNITAKRWMGNTPNEAEISGIADKLYNRGFWKCSPIGDSTVAYISMIPIGISTFIMEIMSEIIAANINADLICSDPTATNLNCINLLKIIGGVNSQTVLSPTVVNGQVVNNQTVVNSQSEGIIGSLTGGLYYPLLVMIVGLSAFTIGWTGIVKRKYREAAGQFAWILASFVVGALILMFPSALVSAPMTIGKTVAGCIIDAFNGGDCGAGNSSSTSNSGANIIDNAGDVTTFTTGNICNSGYTAKNNSSTADIVDAAIHNLTCTIWKAFVFEPFSQAQFNRSLSDLDATVLQGSGPLGRAGLNGEDICVNFHSTKALDDQNNGYLELAPGLSENPICNLAVYQLFLQADVRIDDPPEAISSPDYRWFNVISTAAYDDEIWAAWNLNLVNGAEKLVNALIMLIGSIIGGGVLVIISITALMFLVTSILLLALAPLFLLLGIHPTKGKKIMLGWLEQVTSNLLKYIASVVFLLVAISLFAGIFGNIDNPVFLLIAILLMSAAIFMYRKEFIELIGRVNMGGEQMSNKFAGTFDRAKRRTSAAIGSGLAAGAMTKGSFKDKRTAVTSAVGSGIKRDLRAGGGIIASGIQQADRMSTTNKSKFGEKVSEVKEKQRSAEEQLTTAQNDIGEVRENAVAAEQEVRIKQDALLVEVKALEGSRVETARANIGSLANPENFDKYDKQYNQLSNATLPDNATPEQVATHELAIKNAGFKMALTNEDTSFRDNVGSIATKQSELSITNSEIEAYKATNDEENLSIALDKRESLLKDIRNLSESVDNDILNNKNQLESLQNDRNNLEEAVVQARNNGNREEIELSEEKLTKFNAINDEQIQKLEQIVKATEKLNGEDVLRLTGLHTADALIKNGLDSNSEKAKEIADAKGEFEKSVEDYDKKFDDYVKAQTEIVRTTEDINEMKKLAEKLERTQRNMNQNAQIMSEGKYNSNKKEIDEVLSKLGTSSENPSSKKRVAEIKNEIMNEKGKLGESNPQPVGDKKGNGKKPQGNDKE